MNRCKTCKWWERPSGAWPPTAGYGECGNTTGGKSVEWWDGEYCSWEELDCLTIATAPDFGCVLWEKRDE